MFQSNVDRCKQVEEVTHYLEIFSYSVSEHAVYDQSQSTDR